MYARSLRFKRLLRVVEAILTSYVNVKGGEKVTAPAKPPEKLLVTLDADLMANLKGKADAANKTPSEVVAEMLRQSLK